MREQGHASRQGFKLNPNFEGGQMPLARRVPKRGFFNGAFKKEYAIVNLVDLDARFEAGTVVDEAALRSRGLVKGYNFDGIKILGDGELTKPSRSTPPSSASRRPPRSPPPAARPSPWRSRGDLPRLCPRVEGPTGLPGPERARGRIGRDRRSASRAVSYRK